MRTLLKALALLLIASCGFGAIRAEAEPVTSSLPPMQMGDLFSVVTASDPRFSPDGRFILYNRHGNSAANDAFWSQLWLLRSDGSSERQLKVAGRPDIELGAAEWSPDGKSLAVVAFARGKVLMLQIDPLTGRSRQLAVLPEHPSGLVWSPDGKWLTFAMPVERADAGLTIKLPQPPTGKSWKVKPKITDSLVYRWVDGGPAKPRPYHLFVLDLATGGLHEFKGGPVSVGGFGDFGYLQARPSWSPDSSAIIMTGRSLPEGTDTTRTSDIFRFDLKSWTAQQITSGQGPKDDAQLSPDGRWIAFLGGEADGRMKPAMSLRIMPAAGGTARTISSSLDRPPLTFEWDRSSTSIILGYEDMGAGAIARIDLSGQVTPIARGVGASDSAYVGDGLTISTGPHDLVAYPVQRQWAPGDIAIAQGGTERILTSVNEPLITSRQLGETRERLIQSSFDGKQIHAFVTLPPGFTPSRKYPLILEIHGGPNAAWGGHFDYEKQLLAAQGYVVLLVNPRGSTGYGQAFTDEIERRFPGPGDTADLLSAVDDLAKEPWIDQERLYVSGGSGGGTLTAWLIGHTDRFRAAAAYYMVSDWTSLGLTNDMPRRWTYSTFKAYPWEDHELYWQNSPLRMVGEVKTPTLVMVGEQDWRTPPSQSEMFFTALRLRGVEARLVHFPGGTHGLGGTPSERMAKVSAIIDWFDTHGGRTPH